MDNISIIIPAYNCEKTIGNLIESIIYQLWDNDELIIIDDGSTDQTFNIISSFNDPRIKKIRCKNSGPANARNLGIDSIEKKGYIWFIDADDQIDANAIDLIHKNLIYNKDIICYGYLKKTKINGNIKECNKILFNNNTDNGDIIIEEMLDKQLYNILWNKIIKYSFLIKNNLKFKNVPLIEDVSFVNDMIKLKPALMAFKSMIYVYNIDLNCKQTVSTKFYPERLDMAIKLNKEYCEIYNLFQLSKGTYNRINTIFLLDIYLSLIQFYQNDTFNQNKLNDNINYIIRSDYIHKKIKFAKPTSKGAVFIKYLIYFKFKALLKLFLHYKSEI